MITESEDARKGNEKERKPNQPETIPVKYRACKTRSQDLNKILGPELRRGQENNMPSRYNMMKHMHLQQENLTAKLYIISD